MKMALPRDIPTLQASSTGNYTRTDNVFCTTPLLCSFVTCNTDPGIRPINTDHIPIVYELDVHPVQTKHVPRPLWKQTDWDEFRSTLFGELQNIPLLREYLTREEVDNAIRQLRAAIQGRMVGSLMASMRASPLSRSSTLRLAEPSMP
ncbi:hypothetical protein C8R44DRAFT_633705 [Mycena epipterygia]|nr:hypothetical protein C8R44DRAFT_633705 [Mycena epipterygia]